MNVKVAGEFYILDFTRNILHFSSLQFFFYQS